MEIGFAGFLFLHREEWKKKKEKNESGSVLAGQAGMEVAGWLKVVWAGMKRYAAKGCWPADAGKEFAGWRGCLA